MLNHAYEIPTGAFPSLTSSIASEFPLIALTLGGLLLALGLCGALSVALVRRRAAGAQMAILPVGAGAARRRSIVTALALTVLAAPTAEATSRTVYEERGALKVVEGSECAVYDGHDPGGFPSLKLDFDALVSTGPKVAFAGEWDLPEYADQATVFLNGWRGNYINHDHHVQGLGASISGAHIENETLHWEAGVDLQDGNGNDSIEACYFYTAIAWSTAEIDARVLAPEDVLVDGDTNGDGRRNVGLERHTIRWTIPYSALDAGETVAVLPTAALLKYRGKAHHVFQVGYGLDQVTDRTPTPSGLRVVARGVLRDNKKTRKRYFFGGITAIAGEGIDVIHERFPLLRHKPICKSKFGTSTCVAGGSARAGRWHETFEERGFAYDFVLPILSGYEMVYATSDQHVKRVGAWLNEIDFDAQRGALSYAVTTELQDRNAKPKFNSRHNVTLVGFSRRPRVSNPGYEIDQPEIDAGPGPTPVPRIAPTPSPHVAPTPSPRPETFRPPLTDFDFGGFRLF